MRKRNAVIALFVAFYLGIWLQAGDSDPDFSGKWLLDAASSDTRALGPVEASLTVVQTDAAVSCMAGQLRWSYPLDGSSTRSRFGEEFRSSASKWEGSALLVNTLVSGAQNYTVMERWTLSRDLNTLTIRRQVMRQGSEIEGRSLYRREGASAPNLTSQNGQSEAPMSNRQPTLARRPEPAVEPEIMVRTGTRILLSLINEVSTKRAQEGDRVYLRTAAPVAVNGRVVIPAGSDVAGTITRTKAAKLSAKARCSCALIRWFCPTASSVTFSPVRRVGKDASTATGGLPTDAP